MSLLKIAYSTKEIAQFCGKTPQWVTLKANKEAWKVYEKKGFGGGRFWCFESMPEKIKNIIRTAELKNLPAIEEPVQNIKVETKEPVYSAAKKDKALARADLLCLYEDYQQKNGKTVKSKEDFIAKYESQAYPELYNKLGSLRLFQLRLKI